jgi:hypothetical protein
VQPTYSRAFLRAPAARRTCGASARCFLDRVKRRPGCPAKLAPPRAVGIRVLRRVPSKEARVEGHDAGDLPGVMA